MNPDPSPLLVASFRAAAARMEGLGLVNPALAVEAIGFAPWGGHWLGVLLTPWFMNLVLTPRDPAQWTPLAPGATRRLAFPAGEFEFIGGHDAAVGAYQMCSLFSPVQEFADMDSARLVAQLAREALFDDDNAERPEMPEANLTPAAPGPLARLDARLAAPMSRRDLLRGRFAGADDEPRR